METITFYSYKGGVGRTLALSNTATYLSRFGLNVCVLDFDLEAPGLHYKFGLDSKEIKKGLVDYIFDFYSAHEINQIKEYSINISKQGDGQISIIPAGAVATSEYWKKLSEINWSDLLYDANNKGILFFLELKEKIKNEIKPDFLLIDSRTGVTEIGGICTSLLADKVVFLLTNNNENLEGSCQILKSLKKAERLPNQEIIKPYFVLTRIPISKEAEQGVEEKIINNVRNKLKAIEKTDIKELLVIHSDRELELSETLTINNLKNQTQSSLLNDYLKLFSQIIPENIIVPKLDIFIKKILNDLIEEPDKTQSELENLVVSYQHSKTYESLLNFYILRNIFDERFIKGFERYIEISASKINEKLFNKYIELFIKDEYQSWRRSNFNLKIIEKNLKKVTKFKFETTFKLALFYKSQDSKNHALELLQTLLDNQDKQTVVIQEILKIYNESKDLVNASKFFNEFKELIEKNLPLKIIYISIITKQNDLEELNRLLSDDNGITERYIVENEFELAIDVFQRLNRVNEIYNKIDNILNEAIGKGGRQLYEVGRLFKRIGKFDDFKNKVAHLDEGKEIIRDIERRFGRY